MNSNQSQEQRQQQSGQGNNASPGQQRADQAPDLKPVPEHGSEGSAPDKGDSNRTPWQGQQPRQQQGSRSEDTDDAGDTRPNSDHHQASGNN